MADRGGAAAGKDAEGADTGRESRPEAPGVAGDGEATMEGGCGDNPVRGGVDAHPAEDASTGSSSRPRRAPILGSSTGRGKASDPSPGSPPPEASEDPGKGKALGVEDVAAPAGARATRRQGCVNEETAAAAARAFGTLPERTPATEVARLAAAGSHIATATWPRAPNRACTGTRAPPAAELEVAPGPCSEAFPVWPCRRRHRRRRRPPASEGGGEGAAVTEGCEGSDVEMMMG